MSIVKQNSWLAGEINPDLTEASSNPLYFQSALTLENVYVSKSQTLKRIPSSSLVSFSPTPTSIYQDAITAKFEGDNYVIFWSDDGVFTSYIYDDLTEILTFVGTYDQQYTDKYVDYVTFDSRAIFTYTDRPPLLIDFTETGANNATIFNFINQPTLDFGDVDYSTFTFDVKVADTDTSEIEITGTNAGLLFTDEWIGGMFFSIGTNTSDFIGQMKITSRTDGGNDLVTFEGDTLHELEKETFQGTAVVMQKPIFFDDTEYPRIVSFFESRLYFGNTKSLPMLVTGSRINLINDFNVGKQLPAESIVYILNDTSSSEVKHIVGHIGLFIYTDKNEHVVIPSIDGGITPTTFISQRLSDWGSNNIKPVIYDNTILFVDKVSRKILRINSASTNSFQVDEITIGMEIENDIFFIGVIDDTHIDDKLLAFGYTGNSEISLVNIGAETAARTRYQAYPSNNVDISSIIFASIDRSTLLLAVDGMGVNQVTVNSFTNDTSGLTSVRDVVVGSSFTPDANGYLFNEITEEYLFTPEGILVTVPTDFTKWGYLTILNIKSIPLTLQNQDSWDYKSVSYLFISYFRSARFLVNGSPVAFPTLTEISNPSPPLKTDYEKINRSTSSDRFNYIEITSNEPYNIEIQAYGWSIVPTIMD